MLRTSRLAFVAMLFVAASCAPAPTAPHATDNRAGHDWPQWLGPQRTGLTTETGLLKQWPEGGPERVWLFENCGTGYAGPAIVGDRLYILGGRDGNCQLLALDANTGEEIWAATLGPTYENDWGDGPRATPTIENGLIYAMGAKGMLVCIRAADGSEVWRTDLQADLAGTEPKWGYCESVLIDGDQLLCTPGGSGGAVAALDKATGKVLWRATELDDEAHYSSIQRVELHGQPQYVQLLVSRLVGLAPEDGRVLWQVDWPGRVAVIPTPIVHGDKVFATSGYGVGCMLVDVDENNVATEIYDEPAKKLMKNHHGGVLLVDDHLYGHSDGVGWVCMEFATGKQVWRERDALGKGAIAYADGMFYCLGEDDGQVALIEASPEGWKEHGRFTLDPQTEIRKDRGKIWMHPVIANGKLYLRDQNLVYCYDIAVK
jgi:outer membrane protein assembly factor BamB